jgi:hypothetical protein
VVVGRVFVDFSVVKDVVTVGRPSSSEPLVSVLIDYTFLGVVMVNVVHSVLLDLNVLSVIVAVLVLVIRGSTESSNGLVDERESFRSTLKHVHFNN